MTHDASLRSGGDILRSLPERNDRSDLFIDRSSLWHCGGIPATPADIFSRHDVLVNALQDSGPELHTLLRRYNVHHTGSSLLGTAVAGKQELAREHLKRAGLHTMRGMALRRGTQSLRDIGRAVLAQIPPPWLIKPLGEHSSRASWSVRTTRDLTGALEEAFSRHESVFLEELIDGRIGSCFVLENFRGYELYALPLVEVVRSIARDGVSRTLSPASFPPEVKIAIEDTARRAHNALGLRHYSRTNFIVGKRGVFVLETDPFPSLAADSTFARAVAEVGSLYPQMLEHLINLALQ